MPLRHHERGRRGRQRDHLDAGRRPDAPREHHVEAPVGEHRRRPRRGEPPAPRSTAPGRRGAASRAPGPGRPGRRRWWRRPRASRPVRGRGRARGRTPASAAASTASASASSASPAAVGRTSREVRSSSSTPSSRSSWATDFETACCARCSCAAARVKLRSRATAAKTRRWRSSGTHNHPWWLDPDRVFPVRGGGGDHGSHDYHASHERPPEPRSPAASTARSRS